MFMSHNLLQGGGVSVDTAGWKDSAVAHSGLARRSTLQSACQGPPSYSQTTQCLYSGLSEAAGPSSTETAAEVAAWLYQQQLLAGGAYLQSTSWGPQALQSVSIDDVTMAKGQQLTSAPSMNGQWKTQQHSSVCKDSSLVFSSVVGSAAQSHGTHAATATATATATVNGLQLPPVCSDHSDSVLSAGNVMSPAAFVHNAQQMLWQQQQQMQQYQQQQMLLGVQQYNNALHKQQQQQNKLGDSHAPTASVVATDPAGSMACPEPSMQEAAAPLPSSKVRSPSTVRAALGDRVFFSIRSLLMMQQETFVQQLCELHRLVHVQQMACSEISSEHHALTQQYGKAAMTQLQSSQGAQKGNIAAGKSASATLASAAAQTARQPAPTVLGGELPAWSDDRGAAAVAALPVHAVLMRSLPSSVRAAVSPPHVQDCSALNPARCYIKRHVGVLRPVAVKAAMKHKGKVTGGNEAAVVAMAEITVSDGATVQMDAAAPTTSGSHQMPQRQQAGNNVGDARSHQLVSRIVGRYQSGTCSAGSKPCLGELDQPPPCAAPGAGPGALGKLLAGEVVMPGTTGDNILDRRQWQQHQAMPPPPPMRPELAAKHAAAAAASHHQQMLLQQQLDSEGQVAAAAGVAGASALNVFRPMPQIDPSFASKFLAGGQCDAAAAAATLSHFDPHSFWMNKHYGGRATSQSMSAPNSAVDVNGKRRQQQSGAGDCVPLTAASQLQRSQITYTGTVADGQACPSASASGNQPVVHWWQDAAATFGDVGLLDPNATGPVVDAQQDMEGWSNGKKYNMSSKRMESQYQLQQLPHKKRVKLSVTGGEAAAAVSGAGFYSPYSCYPEMVGSQHPGAVQYGVEEAGDVGHGRMMEDVGAFKPVVRRPPSKQRSRVRSNRLGSSCQGESVCSDNSASSIDNPNLSAAAAAVRAGSRVDLGPDADGVSLLLHIGQHADKPTRANSARSAAVMGNDSRASDRMQAAGKLHSNDKSAAALLLSLSGSLG